MIGGARLWAQALCFAATGLVPPLGIAGKAEPLLAVSFG
jgi:hypothetical protein